MTLWQSVILGAVQGLTEFLPVSSSGHLVLTETVFGMKDLAAEKGFDVAIHVGTLLAIFVYFRRDFAELIVAGWKWLMKGFKETGMAEAERGQVKMIKILVVGTIPAIFFGLLFNDLIDKYLMNPLSVTLLLAVFSVVFLLAEEYYGRLKHHSEISWKEGMLIGLGQCLALIPGVSRSGATITTGLFLGVERAKAARFSFLLGSVAILAAACYAFLEVAKGKYPLPPTDILLAGIGTSFLTGWMAISFLINYLKKHTLAVFAWYRILLVIAFWGFTYIAAMMVAN